MTHKMLEINHFSFAVFEVCFKNADSRIPNQVKCRRLPRASRTGGVTRGQPSCCPRQIQSHPVFFSPFRRILGLRNGDFQNHRLAIWNERLLIGGQCSEKRQIHPLHRGLDAPQGIAAHGNLVRGEDQSEVLLLSLGFEFGEGELVKRQQQAPFSRQFDFDAVSVRVARPAFG